MLITSTLNQFDSTKKMSFCSTFERFRILKAEIFKSKSKIPNFQDPEQERNLSLKTKQ